MNGEAFEWPGPSIPCALERGLFVNRGRKVATPPSGFPVWVKGLWNDAEAYERPVRREVEMEGVKGKIALPVSARDVKVIVGAMADEASTVADVETAVEMLREVASDDRVPVATLRRWARIGLERASESSSWEMAEVHARMAADLLARAKAREAEERVREDHPLRVMVRSCVGCRGLIYAGELVVFEREGLRHRRCRTT